MQLQTNESLQQCQISVAENLPFTSKRTKTRKGLKDRLRLQKRADALLESTQSMASATDLSAAEIGLCDPWEMLPRSIGSNEREQKAPNIYEVDPKSCGASAGMRSNEKSDEARDDGEQKGAAIAADLGAGAGEFDHSVIKVLESQQSMAGAELQARLDGAEKRAEIMQAEFQHLQDRCAAMQESLACVKEDHAKAETELSSVRQHAESLACRLCDAEKHVDMVSLDCKQARDRCVIMEATLESAKDDLAKAETDLISARQHAESLASLLENAEKRVDIALAEGHEAEARYAELKASTLVRCNEAANVISSIKPGTYELDLNVKVLNVTEIRNMNACEREQWSLQERTFSDTEDCEDEGCDDEQGHEYLFIQEVRVGDVTGVVTLWIICETEDPCITSDDVGSIVQVCNAKVFMTGSDEAAYIRLCINKHRLHKPICIIPHIGDEDMSAKCFQKSEGPQTH
jgi:hypothetical protein